MPSNSLWSVDNKDDNDEDLKYIGIILATMIRQLTRVYKIDRIFRFLAIPYNGNALSAIFQYKPPKLGFGWILNFIPVVAAAQYMSDECPKDITEVIRRADHLYEEHSYKKLRELLLKYKHVDNAEILWRLARAEYEMAKLASSYIEQKHLNLEAYSYIERAFALDRNNFAVHKWMFILLDKKSSYEGIKERISQSFVVKRHIEKACELNPSDPTSFHLLGYYCFAVSQLPWYQRQIASTLFATPPTSSYEEALTYFLKAEEIEPNFYSTNLLMIGKTYLQMKDKARAVDYIQRAADYPVRTTEDAEVKEEATRLLKSL